MSECDYGLDCANGKMGDQRDHGSGGDRLYFPQEEEGDGDAGSDGSGEALDLPEARGFVAQIETTLQKPDKYRISHDSQSEPPFSRIWFINAPQSSNYEQYGIEIDLFFRR